MPKGPGAIDVPTHGASMQGEHFAEAPNKCLVVRGLNTNTTEEEVRELDPPPVAVRSLMICIAPSLWKRFECTRRWKKFDWFVTSKRKYPVDSASLNFSPSRYSIPAYFEGNVYLTIIYCSTPHILSMLHRGWQLVGQLTWLKSDLWADIAEILYFSNLDSNTDSGKIFCI